ncbi:MAG: recombinase family protein, partial [SAR324 cluster bacterium]|nr:recombinase family protein [SAR324 cluster bacterium]
MSVYGYIRLNTSVETPEGLGFKEQTQKINAWAAESKLEIKKIHRDKEPTSSSLDLPRLAKLTKQIDQGKVTVLVVVRLD